MVEHSSVNPETQQILTRGWQTSRKAVSGACENMRIIEEKQDHTEKPLS